MKVIVLVAVSSILLASIADAAWKKKSKDTEESFNPKKQRLLIKTTGEPKSNKQLAIYLHDKNAKKTHPYHYLIVIKGKIKDGTPRYDLESPCAYSQEFDKEKYEEALKKDGTNIWGFTVNDGEMTIHLNDVKVATDRDCDVKRGEKNDEKIEKKRGTSRQYATLKNINKFSFYPLDKASEEYQIEKI